MSVPTPLVLLAAVAAVLAVGLQGPPRRHVPRVVDRSGAVPGWWRSRLGSRQPMPILELMEGLAAELAAGQPTRFALASAAADLPRPACPRAVRAARSGGDVAAALRQDARAPGAGDLRALAACWEVAEHSGAGLQLAVARMAAGLRASEQARAQLAAEVAAVAATARILAALPLAGLAIGQWVGADPLSWLVGGWAGRGVLALGLVLQAGGLLWLRAMVARARAGL